MDVETTYVEMADFEARDAGNGTHELEGLCVPYDVPTSRVGPRPEIFRAGAFATAVTVPEKIRLFDNNHDRKARPVAKAAHLEERSGGLYGRFRFYNTPQGRAAYENVREETYGGLSIGFVAKDHRNTPAGREVTAAFLHHVSLVDEPAYDDAKILAVRAAETTAAAAAAERYAFLRTPPTLDVALSDDTPLMVELRRRRL